MGKAGNTEMQNHQIARYDWLYVFLPLSLPLPDGIPYGYRRGLAECECPASPASMSPCENSEP